MLHALTLLFAHSFRQDLSDEELKQILAVLRNANVEHLSFAVYHLSSPTLSLLEDVMSSMPSLQSLDMSGTIFEADSRTSLLGALKQDRKLERLCLAHTNVNSGKIATALKNHPKLKILK